MTFRHVYVVGQVFFTPRLCWIQTHNVNGDGL